jgi:hypothetical protein
MDEIAIFIDLESDSADKPDGYDMYCEIASAFHRFIRCYQDYSVVFSRDTGIGSLQWLQSIGQSGELRS